MITSFFYPYLKKKYSDRLMKKGRQIHLVCRGRSNKNETNYIWKAYSITQGGELIRNLQEIDTRALK